MGKTMQKRTKDSCSTAGASCGPPLSLSTTCPQRDLSLRVENCDYISSASEENVFPFVCGFFDFFFLLVTLHLLGDDVRFLCISIRNLAYWCLMRITG